MEYVTHTCGTALWRHEAGGVARIVLYGRVGDTREIHVCPTCGKPLSDRVLTDERGQAIDTRVGLPQSRA